MDRVSSLLAQFPGPLILRPSRWKWLGILAVSAIFTGGGIAENLDAGSTSILAWTGVVFFGVLTGCAAIAIFPGTFRMSLDADGFTLRVARRSERWRWIDVGDFAVVEYKPGVLGASVKGVGFNDKRPNKGMSQRVGERMSQGMTGRDCELPDTLGATAFGLPMEDLVSLMSRWQQRAMALREASASTASMLGEGAGEPISRGP